MKNDSNFNNYKYYVSDGKVIAVSSYAKKTVRGVAKCSPNDVFDLEKGKKLAAARCNLKVAQKRNYRALHNWAEKLVENAIAQNELNEASDYYLDSNKKLIEARKALEVIEESM